MALRDDLMVVIPDELFGGVEAVGTFFRGGQAPNRSVKDLRKRRNEWSAAQPHVKQWLATFETDPETVIVVPEGLGVEVCRVTLRQLWDWRVASRTKVPEWRRFLDTFETIESVTFDPLIKVPAGIAVDLSILHVALLSELRELSPDRGTKHGQAWLAKATTLADDIEIVIPEEVLTEGWFTFSDGVAWVQTLRSHAKRIAAWGRYPATVAFLKHFAPKVESVTVSAGELPPMKEGVEPQRRVLPLPRTRLERVAAGLEADPYKVVYDNDLSNSTTAKAPAFSLRPPKPVLTIEPDPADGDDVCADVSSDRYFGVKR